MHRHAHTVAFAALLLLAACPKTDNNVGSVPRDSGVGGQSSQAGGATSASGGSGGGGSDAAGCVYQGVTYAIGASYKLDCNHCICGLNGDGNFACTAVGCLVDGGWQVTTDAPSGTGGTIASDAGDDEPVDGNSCQAPNVWGYEEPGCDGQAQPTCGLGNEDLCPGLACACDGDILWGCDVFPKPIRSRGLCPDACYSPTRGVMALATYGKFMKGCACDPATDQPQCVAGSWHFACVGGFWNAKHVTSCDIGATCDLGAAVSLSDGTSECSTGLCLKPVVQAATGTVDTGPFCTGQCSTDSDCEGITRDPSNPNDKTCTSGYTCGIAIAKGPLCCQQLCVCKDFTGGAAIPTPIACQGDAALTCN